MLEWTKEDAGRLRAHPLGEKAMRFIDWKIECARRDVLNAALPGVPKEETCYQKGGLDAVEGLRLGLFEVDADE